MKWYDFFAGFYDSSLEKLYFAGRRRAVQLLDLRPKCTVLDVACGTGANFGHLLDAKVPVTVFGTDFSAGMLAKARQKIARAGWEDVHLFEADARQLTPAMVRKAGQAAGVDRVLCFLGLSVLPDWEKVLDRMLGLLPPGGRIVVADVHAEKRTASTWLVERIAKADLRRQIAPALAERTAEFHQETLPVSPRKVGGQMFVATGLKR